MSRRCGQVTRSIGWLGFGLLLLGTPASSAETDRYPANSILLLVASWCAPCHAELANLPAITRGALPFGTLVVPFDDSPATRSMLERVPAAQRWQPGRAMQRRLMQDVAAGTAGLPFSLGVNGDGEICGSARQGLDGQSAKALVARCLR